MQVANRWVIASAGIFMQIALGAVYAWSVFRIPLARQFGWSIPQVTLTFTISIFVLGVSAFFGGLWLNRSGPRIVALTAGFLYGAGVFLASFSDNKLWWLYLSYGVIGGGIGLGFATLCRYAREMVSRAPRLDHRSRGRRIRRGRADHRARGHAPDSNRRSVAYVRLPGVAFLIVTRLLARSCRTRRMDGSPRDGLPPQRRFLSEPSGITRWEKP